MKLLTHINQIDRQLPESPLKSHIQARFDQLSEDTDVPPNFILVESGDDITGPNYSFVSEDNGLLGDGDIGSPQYCRPYENVSYLPELHLYEALYLVNGEDGYWIIIPASSIVDAHPDLEWVLTDESQGGLSPPQPL